MPSQLLKEMDKEFVPQGFVRSVQSGKTLEKLGASFGDSAAIQAQNAKLRALGMPADDEDPVRLPASSHVEMHDTQALWAFRVSSSRCQAYHESFL